MSVKPELIVYTFDAIRETLRDKLESDLSYEVWFDNAEIQLVAIHDETGEIARDVLNSDLGKGPWSWGVEVRLDPEAGP